MPTLFPDLVGTIATLFQIGNGQSGSKTLRFKNSAGQIDLVADPTSNVTQILPDQSGSLLTQFDGYYNARTICLDHFAGGLTDWASSTTGAGATVLTNIIADPGGRPGIAQCNIGTATVGRAGVATSTGAVLLSTSDSNAYFRCDMRVPILSTGTETFTIRAGLSTDTGSTPANYIWFRYLHSVNSGNWQCCTRQNSGTETVTNTSVPLSANTWQTLQWIYDSVSADVRFYIDGTLVATITTTIPTAAGQTMQGNIYALKSAGSTTRTMELDYAFLGVNL